MPRQKATSTLENMMEKLKRATDEILLLSTLKTHPMYTYEIMHNIEHMSGGKIVFLSLYQTVNRLQDGGYVCIDSKQLSDDNRLRIYFAITQSGLEYLDALVREYRDYTAIMEKFIEN